MLFEGRLAGHIHQLHCSATLENVFSAAACDAAQECALGGAACRDVFDVAWVARLRATTKGVAEGALAAASRRRG